MHQTWNVPPLWEEEGRNDIPPHLKERAVEVIQQPHTARDLPTLVFRVDTNSIEFLSCLKLDPFLAGAKANRRVGMSRRLRVAWGRLSAYRLLPIKSHKRCITTLQNTVMTQQNVTV
jgi:hypothetical protein